MVFCQADPGTLAGGTLLTRPLLGVAPARIPLAPPLPATAESPSHPAAAVLPPDFLWPSSVRPSLSDSSKTWRKASRSSPGDIFGIAMVKGRSRSQMVLVAMSGPPLHVPWGGLLGEPSPGWPWSGGHMPVAANPGYRLSFSKAAAIADSAAEPHSSLSIPALLSPTGRLWCLKSSLLVVGEVKWYGADGTVVS